MSIHVMRTLRYYNMTRGGFTPAAFKAFAAERRAFKPVKRQSEKARLASYAKSQRRLKLVKGAGKKQASGWARWKAKGGGRGRRRRAA